LHASTPVIELPSASIVLRPARLADAVTAAKLIRMSMQPSVDFLFGTGYRLSADQTLIALFQRADNRFSAQETTIALVNGEMAGGLVSYPGHRLTALDLGTGRQLAGLYGLGGIVRLALLTMPLARIREAGPGEYFVSNLAVLPHFQRQGIGRHMLAYAEQQARQTGLIKCSLLVDSKNTAACHLYERLGYQVVSSGQIRFPGRSMPAWDYHRMVKRLT
jgi:ribosomal protein S18 acetylase RimI-like enzyme